MYGNQIMKRLYGFKEWMSDGYSFQTETMLQLIQTHHHFSFGAYSEFKGGMDKRMANKEIFMDDSAYNLKFPYGAFLLCFSAKNTDPVGISKYAMMIQKYDADDVGVCIEYMVSYENSNWILFPFTRLYLFNKNLEEGRDHWKELGIEPMTDGDVPLYQTNTAIFPSIKPELGKEFTDPSENNVEMQRTLGGIANYFLLLYNQKYITTETVYRNKPNVKRKKNKRRLFDYKVLSVQLPKSGKKYRYGSTDVDSKGIMPFTDVPGHWRTYTEEGGGMFGKPNLIGDFWIPDHVRGSKSAGFSSHDYCVSTND